MCVVNPLKVENPEVAPGIPWNCAICWTERACESKETDVAVKGLERHGMGARGGWGGALPPSGRT